MSTRSLGFSLTVKGSDQTTKQLDLIKAKLGEVTKEIKAIKATPISLSTKFDSKSISDFLKTLEKVKTTKFNPELQKDFAKLKSELINVKREMTLLQSQLEKTKEPVLTGSGLDKINGKIIKMNGHAKEAVETLTKIGPTLTAIKDHNVDQLDKSLGSMLVKLKEIQGQKKITLANPNLSGAEKSAILDSLLAQESKLKEQFKETSAQIEIQNKAFRAQASAFPVDSIIGLRKEVGLLKKEYDSLPQAEREAAKGQALITSINQKKQVINDANELMGNFQHKVGNYKTAVTGLLPELEKLQGEGRIAQKELIDVFRKENIARAAELEKKIQDLAIEFKSLGTAAENAGKRAAVLDQLTNATRELSAVSSNTQKIGNDFQRLQGKLLGVSDIVTGGLIGGGILATIGAVKSFGASSLAEFTQASTALAKINQQLIVTGGASGKSAEGLQRTAKELEVLTGIDGDQILNDVTSSLLRFGSIQGEVFDKAQKAAIDLSATMGGDLAGAANLVGKALEDPEKGITRLAKAGVILDKETEKAVKNAIKSNDTYKAQTILLGALESKFKGVAEAVQNTELQGIRRLTVAFNNFKEAVGGIFIRIVNDALNAIKDLSLGVSIFNTTNKELTRGLAELQQSAQKEIDSIRATISALGDENFNRDAKKKLIEDLVAKYPELINQLQLEYASKEGLIQIEKLLTETVIDQTTKRIEAKKKEDLIQQQLEAVANLSRLQRGDLTFAEKFTQGLSGKDLVKETENKIKALTKELDLVPVQFAEMSKKLKDINKVTETDIKTSVSFVKDGINSIIGEANKVLLDDKLPKSAKTTAQRLKSEFENKKVSINIDEASTDQLDKLGNQIKSAQRELIGLRTTASQKTKVSLDGEDYKKQQKTIEDNYKRILDLKRQIEDLKLGNIANVFDQQIEKLKATTRRQIEDIQKDLNSLELKSVKSPQDLQIITQSKILISDLQKEANRQIDLINVDRAAALNEASKKLYETQTEVQSIIREVNKTKIEIEIDTAQFELEQAERTIKLNFDSNLNDLDNEFSKGLVSQKDYEDRSKQLEIDRLEAVAKLHKDHQAEFIKALQIKADAEKTILDETTQNRKAAILDQLKLDNLQIDQDQRAGKITVTDAFTQKVVNYQKAVKQIEQIDIDHKKQTIDIGQETQVSINSIIDAGVAAHGAAEQAKTDKTKQETAERLAIEEERLQQLKESSIDLAGEIASAILEIDASRAEQRYNQEKTFLEREYDNRIKLAAGNSSEITKLERDRDQKLRELERQQSIRRKKQAISEAIINTSLGVLKAIATQQYLAIPFILATGAIQIAKIKAQSFAKGAYFNKKGVGGFTGASQAPPDETGERPIGTGILHADEFIMTARQTRKHNWLAHLLDKDRLKTNAGGTSSLEMDLAEAIQRRRQAIYNIPKPSEAKYTPIIPVIVPVGGQSLNQEVKFSDEQIDRMAEIMGEKIANKSGNAIYSGSKDGLVEATKETLRKERTTLRATA